LKSDFAFIEGMSFTLAHREKLEVYRTQLARRTFFSGSQLDAILYYLHEHYREARPRVIAGFKKDLLYGIQLINGYAAEQKIRVEDALLVLHTYATSPLEHNEVVTDE
jgi:hypothetical protein